MTSSLSPVTFHGDTIYCIAYQNQPYTAMKPIVENLGLGWASQSQKLNSNKGRWGVTIIVIPSSSGEQNTLCMPVRKLPAYLASINPNKVRPELREKVIQYQNECDDVLWDYWTKKQQEKALPARRGRPKQATIYDDVREMHDMERRLRLLVQTVQLHGLHGIAADDDAVDRKLTELRNAHIRQAADCLLVAKCAITAALA